jgi:hypothetical protein
MADRPSGGADLTARRFMVGVAAPLGLVALAYGLWWASDRLGHVGPFDRATFGWMVVIPIWLAAPVVAGFLWSRLDDGQDWLAALLVAVLVGVPAAVLFWQAATDVDCAYGPTRTPADWFLPSVVLGVVVGGGLALSGMLATVPAKARRLWWTIVAGVGTELAMVFVAIMTVAPFLGPMCNRPTG